MCRKHRPIHHLYVILDKEVIVILRKPFQDSVLREAYSFASFGIDQRNFPPLAEPATRLVIAIE
jgi:hypothetical protein